MRSRFDAQLFELNKEMTNMGTMIERSITKAVDVLTRRDEKLANEIMTGDDQIDHAQKQIETICFNLLIQQQPVAKDLRTITAAMKMVTDMERIGDHAADIAETTLCMGNKKSHASFKHINKMASETILMLNWSIDAYVKRDRELAEKVITHDDIVDELFENVKNDIIQLILNNPNEGEEAVDLLMIAKYFERIGDHATNIAEWVIYSLKTSE